MRSKTAVVVAFLFVCSSAQADPKARLEKEVEEQVRVLKTAKEPEARVEAITKIVRLEAVRRGVAKNATPQVAQALKDGDATVRAAAAEALGELGHDPKTWVADLARLLDDKEDRNARLAAIDTLGRVGKDAGVALEALAAIQKKEMDKAEDQRDNDLLQAAAQAVAQIQAGFLGLGAWYYIGPFDSPDNTGFKTEFPPEKEIDLKKTYAGKNGAKASWAKGNFTDGEVNSLALFEEKNNTYAVVYLYREIDCERPAEATLSLGSDDTLTVWLNGEKLLSEEVYRGAEADQNKVTLKLKKGKNRFLMKICQGDGDWAFYFRVTSVTLSRSGE
jgi:hypothetical protein